MPRTVEGIVRSHQLAVERCRQDRPIWDRTLHFMKPLTALAERHNEGDETLTAQALLNAFHAAAIEVREKVPQASGDTFDSKDEDLEAFVTTMEQWTLAHVEAAKSIFDEFDDVLDRLYDWADENRVWIASF